MRFSQSVYTPGRTRWRLIGDNPADAAKLRVARTLSRAQSGARFTTPKNGHGRTISLTPRAAQNVERLRAGSAWHDEGLIFTNATGSYLRIETLHAHSFKPLLKGAGLPDIRFHDLRHTAATLLLSRGVHPRFVQELLGHSSAGITLDTYLHFMPSMGDQTAVAMDDALS